MYKLKKGFTLWFCGLSSAGKTTISNELTKLFRKNNLSVFPIDGDEIRPIIAPELGYKISDRIAVAERYAKLALLLNRNQIISIVAAINHTEKQRAHARKLHQNGNLFIVWIDTPLEECIKRDRKGLYKKAQQGKIKDMVGISIPFENPKQYDVRIDTVQNNIAACVSIIFEYLCQQKMIVLVK